MKKGAITFLKDKKRGVNAHKIRYFITLWNLFEKLSILVYDKHFQKFYGIIRSNLTKSTYLKV